MRFQVDKTTRHDCCDCLKPQLLIADEPTTAVTVQKEIIQLLKDIQQETGMSIIFISHDLSLVSAIAHRVVVMYQGEIVSKGSKTNFKIRNIIIRKLNCFASLLDFD
jgi:ABC-type dipeptide/oligopeptide/nickel transport system ATPase component